MPWGIAAAALGSAVIGGLSANSAADAQSSATDRAVGAQNDQYLQNRADLAPYREAGQAALTRLRSLLGIDSSGTGSPDSSPLLRKFSSSDLESDPVYQNGLKFGVDEGTKAIERRAAAIGSYDSGGTLKALTRYGTDYGSTKAADSYSRFRDFQDSNYGKLAGIAGMGSGATNVGVGANTATGSNLAALYTGQGNANAAATIAGGNAITGAIGNGMNYYYLNKLTGGGQRTPAGDPSLVGGAN